MTEEERKRKIDAMRRFIPDQAGPMGPIGPSTQQPKKKSYWALPDDASNPMTWIKGVGQAGKEIMWDPMYKTFSGREAMGNYLNPKGGFGPTRMAERAVGAMSDALNVLGVVPIVGSIAKGSVAAENAIGRALFSRGIQTPAARNLSKSLAERSALAAGEVSALEKSAMEKIADRGAHDIRSPQWTEQLPKGITRFWHTNPDGGKLPESLLSMEESARIAERRGSGNSQLLSGGVYATTDPALSASYGDKSIKLDLGLGRTPNKRIIEESLDMTPQKYPNYGIFEEDLAHLSDIRKREFFDKSFNIKDEVPEDIADKLRSAYSYYSNNPNVQKLTSEQISMADKAKTWEDFLKLTPSHSQESWVVDVSRIAGRPITFSSQTPARYSIDNATLMKGAPRGGWIVDSEHPFTIVPPEGVKNVPGSELEQAFRNYSNRFAYKQFEEFYPHEEQKALFDAIQQTIRYKQGNINAVTGKPFTDEELSYIDENISKLIKQYYGTFAEHKKYASQFDPFASLKRTLENGGNDSIGIHSQLGEPTVILNKTPGMNYWDLPVTMDDVGAITDIGGLGALDIGRLNPENTKVINNAIREFFNKELTPLGRQKYSQELNSLLSEVEQLYYFDPAEQLRRFRNIGDYLNNLIGYADPSVLTAKAPKLYPKERWYQFLKDQYGIESIPHGGGLTLGGKKHQAVVFNAPEKLPPSMYVPGSVSETENVIKELARARMRQFSAYEDMQNPMKYLRSPNVGQQNPGRFIPIPAAYASSLYGSNNRR